MNQKKGFKAPLGLLLIGISALLVCSQFVSIFINSAKMKSIQKTDEELYYNMLYTISTTLINADRDFYQAQLAATIYHNNFRGVKNDGLKAEQLAAYEENKQQAIDRVNEASDIAKGYDKLYKEMKTADGANYEALMDSFNENYNIWLEGYDFESNNGNWTEYEAIFEDTRGCISDMTDIVEAWAEEEDATMKAEIQHNIAMIIVIFVILTILVILLVTIDWVCFLKLL